MRPTILLSPVVLMTLLRVARLLALGAGLAQAMGAAPWFPLGSAEANHLVCPPPCVAPACDVPLCDCAGCDCGDAGGGCCGK